MPPTHPKAVNSNGSSSASHHQTAHREREVTAPETCHASSSSQEPTAFSPRPPQSPGSTKDLPPLPPLRIAILLNSYNSPYIAALKRSYEKCLLSMSPSSSLSFYYPAHDMTTYPDPALFDLIVVGGSNVDPRKTHPWVLRVHQFIRDVVREWPQKKIVGICWGHQAMALVFGGRVRDMEVPELGVTTNILTPRGKQFFHFSPSGRIRVQQHHRREVSHPAPDFIPLLEDRQGYVNESNTIITFQGHPEKDAQTALLRLNDATRWYGMDVTDPVVKDMLRKKMEGSHDGDLVWRRILEWVGEGSDGLPRL